jgi:hypothetical protein
MYAGSAHPSACEALNHQTTLANYSPWHLDVFLDLIYVFLLQLTHERIEY